MEQLNISAFHNRTIYRCYDNHNIQFHFSPSGQREILIEFTCGTGSTIGNDIHEMLINMMSDSLLAVAINTGNFISIELKPMQATVEALMGETLQQPTWPALDSEKMMELENRQRSVLALLQNPDKLKREEWKLFHKLSAITLVPPSISKGKDFYPFWNYQNMVFYKKLWFPQKTACVDLNSNSSNGFSTSTIQNLWFSNQSTSLLNENLQKTSLLSCKFLTAAGSEDKDTPFIRCKKIKMIVPKEIQLLRHKFSGLYRYCYNKGVWVNKTSTMRRNLSVAAIIKADHNQEFSSWFWIFQQN
ncbi:hypothetical protein BDK51DRAFT_42949 [Blyttiomyces helicus]|uniref:Uncharacterized protein n=1 Tax=Blyttiomyces helicus TaxID=388810 RepID=A0A4P9WQ39_9FUNG|nr:hypothetical protein BDK51DRAFT_42949 [Blyttiomyces helicus]|eukprot:RKO94485.1 hypothetical protein BDK51DRAFT_42949 [Blyttiomyces helicus]